MIRNNVCVAGAINKFVDGTFHKKALDKSLSLIIYPVLNHIREVKISYQSLVVSIKHFAYISRVM